MSEADPYLDPAHHLLRNKFGLARAAGLDIVERRFVTQRIAEGAPAGDFDFAHLRAIHRHLFQDLYDWAGTARTIDLPESGEHFQSAGKIESDIAAIHRELASKTFLGSLAPGDFAREAALLIGDINFVRPFRAGNERTQLIYLKQLAERAGHPIDLTRLPAEPWIEASQAAMSGDLEPMAGIILFALN